MYVLEGECTVRIGERVHTLGAGMFALMPRDIVHTFSNPGVQNADGAGELRVEVVVDGEVVKESSTTAQYGVVSVNYAPAG